MFMLCCISLNPSPLERGRTTDPLSNRSLQNSLAFLLEFWVLLTKLPQKHFGRLKIKICGNEHSFLIYFSPEKHSRHDLQCKTNECFCEKCNTRLKQNNTTTFLLNYYLSKYAPHMLDVFSTENLSIQHKTLIGLEDQFDLHRLLSFYENNCTLRLVFLVMFFSEG